MSDSAKYENILNRLNKVLRLEHNPKEALEANLRIVGESDSLKAFPEEILHRAYTKLLGLPWLEWDDSKWVKKDIGICMAMNSLQDDMDYYFIVKEDKFVCKYHGVGGGKESIEGTGDTLIAAKLVAQIDFHEVILNYRTELDELYNVEN